MMMASPLVRCRASTHLPRACKWLAGRSGMAMKVVCFLTDCWLIESWGYETATVNCCIEWCWSAGVCCCCSSRWRWSASAGASTVSEPPSSALVAPSGAAYRSESHASPWWLPEPMTGCHMTRTQNTSTCSCACRWTLSPTPGARRAETSTPSPCR